jgi:DNA-3-methyladenine glycosylase
MENIRLPLSFFLRDVLDVAPDLIGKILVRKFHDGNIRRFIITETEAYRGMEDLACHASKGRTSRNEIMFRQGGVVYVYFIYGMYWMLNVVTGSEGDPSAVLIRGLDDISGPGKVGKALQLDRSFYGEDLFVSKRIWIEDSGETASFTMHPRVGIHYAGEPWVSMPWRYKTITNTPRCKRGVDSVLCAFLVYLYVVKINFPPGYP